MRHCVYSCVIDADADDDDNEKKKEETQRMYMNAFVRLSYMFSNACMCVSQHFFSF